MCGLGFLFFWYFFFFFFVVAELAETPYHLFLCSGSKMGEGVVPRLPCCANLHCPPQCKEAGAGVGEWQEEEVWTKPPLVMKMHM